MNAGLEYCAEVLSKMEDANAKDREAVTANAQVQGDLTAGTLVVAEGASFVGHCQVGPHAQELAKGQAGQSGQAGSQARPAQSVQTEAKPNPSIDLTPPWARNNVGAA